VRGLPLVDAAAMGGQALTTDPACQLVLARVVETMLGQLVSTTAGPARTCSPPCGPSWSITGRSRLRPRLHIHRHTLRARMTRIQDLIDADLGSAHVRAELLLALSAAG
jgi:PucR family transcriptional regulator, purine catabolism regulatory protein